ncbi:putative fasciclin-like arabinogalactan protein [Rosa chinensis]|uniref:Putative fasciclin-like arabinogalactan protein n=1 Tax=Rosa chinensis TaxID=74649 RepID=A0A2P6QIP5_ROSCH|nr:fasciclin-like arabinogalactan protein 4 [Rosa chinensis]PRQ34039.1 putative fasciclin-like arabinogalactan protein [Rosa chinensis]
MAFTSPNPHFTPTHFLYFLLLLTSSLPFTLSINITALLSPFPDLSDFTSLLSAAIFSDLSLRSSLTLLAVPNPFLSSTSDLTRHLSPSSRADVLRYHVLLEYLSLSDLARIPPSGKLVTTLYQTTGRATSDFGSVNLTRDPTTGIVSVRSPATFSPSNATVLGLVKTLPYNVSIFSVNSLLVPYGFDLMASETRPPLGLNITKALIDGHNFNVAASMLAASGVVEEFEADEGGAGITLFVPTDTAFSDLPANVRLQSLPADKKSVVLKFHVLHSYYPLGSLESIVNPVQPTLATELVGAGSYTLNISRNNGSVSINTGIIQASVTQTVFDQKPVAIFGVSRVLLPKEIFGSTPAVTSRPGTPVSGGAETPDSAPSPDNSMSGQELSSPPGFKEIKSEGAAITGLWRLGVASCCIALYVMV